MSKTILPFLLAGVFGVTVHAADRTVTATLHASANAAVPGETFTLGIHLKIAPHWHTYWINPGESGQATRIKFSGPAGFEFGEIQWPLPKRIDAPGGFSYGYEDEVLLMVPVRVGKEAAVGSASIHADVSWLVCKEECIKGGAKLSIDLPVASVAKAANAELFGAWNKQLPASPETSGVRVEQPRDNELVLHWKDAPQKIEWFPVATSAVAIDDIKITQADGATRISFKSRIYKADAIVGNQIESVLVYEDTSGRHGVSVPVRLAK